MNIVHELNQLDFGGVEKVIRNIIKYDNKNSHTILADKDGAYREELEKAGAKILLVKGHEDEIDVDADIIHIHSGGDKSNMALSLGKNFPVIETIHSPIRSPITNEFIKQRVGVTDVVSKMNSNCITIYNGIDLNDLAITKPAKQIKEELKIPKGIPVVGRLGRVAPDKGLETWLLVCKRLQDEHINFVPLIVGGEGHDFNGKYIGRLKLMCESLPVKNVIWAGHKSDIASYLRIMDTFLYPSQTEGFGLVFAEAMYCGAVVVTCKNPVTTEVLGGYGVLSEDDRYGLVCGVKTSFNQGYKDVVRPLAYKRVVDDFTAERMSEEYQELYEKVAK